MKNLAAAFILVIVLTVPVCAAPLATLPTLDAQLHYTLWGGGANMADADINMQLDQNTYHGTFSAATKGWIGRLFPWWNRLESHGTVKTRNLVPQDYTATYSWKDKKKHHAAF